MMAANHPSETDLALLAGGDCGRLRRLLLDRHVARCGDCRDTLASFAELRSETIQLGSEQSLPDVNWNQMAGEMRANIRLGIAAGECVGDAPGGDPGGVPGDASRRNWMPQLAFGMTGVLLLAGAGVFLRGLLPHDTAPGIVHAAVLESTGAGVQVRTDSGNSMTLLNRGDVAADQTITSQGAVQSTSVSGGEVTVARVYVE